MKNHDVPEPLKIVYPAQCACGHLFLEKYQFKQVQENGVIGFCWCGFCRTRVNVYPHKEAAALHGKALAELSEEK